MKEFGLVRNLAELGITADMLEEKARTEFSLDVLIFRLYNTIDYKNNISSG